MHEERRQYSEGTDGRSMGGYVADHNTTRRQETIRHNKSKSYWTKYLETGLKDSTRNADQRFRECRNCWKCAETRKDVRRVRNRVAEVGLEYFCPDYVSKNGVSVMERNTMLPATFLCCWDVLSDPLMFSCTCLQSILVYCRLGSPATEIDLAYLYKALAFAHLYVPQSCYHKSSGLSTSGHMTSTPAILTSLLHFWSLIELLIEVSLFTNSPKLIRLHDYPYLHWLG